VKRSFVSVGAESSPQHRHVRARHVAAVVAGNALEFYDFVTYGYFAIYIGRTFFPDIGQHSSLLLSLATFGVGFLTRPLGAIVIGRMGDRIGRKPAMILSFTLMGISLIGLALTPSYAKLGIAAPILVIFFRLAQGFALGGEVGPTTAYLVEAAPPHRRGFYASLSFMTQDASALCAGLVGVALSSALTEQQLQDWGWRAAMLIGAIIVPFGLWMRRALPETIDTDEDGTVASDKSASRSRTDLQPYVRVIVLGLFLLMSATIGNYVLSYMTTYAIDTLKMAPAIAFGAAVVNGVLLVVLEPIGGWLSDRFGRKPVMLVPAIPLLLAIVPCFWVITHAREPVVFYGAIGVLSFLFAIANTPPVILITETLPRHVRSGVLAIVYAVAVSVFGGSTQVTIQWLIDTTGNPLAPAFYWVGALAIGVVAMLLVKESAPSKTKGSAATWSAT
jgi:MFS family permease